ncbi:hypothetical protein AA106555_1250 [Neokomagataea thailandica NBRC 106555]|uniref:Transposase n=1 Tax=Neokomagataea thailandica NBRC 106555 TaxID=1223520 RepID=A0ABQ0QQF3_9PROT|nr:hypothetical protein AA106555_1250 [Neokomagataea thailandica NBRC 106555]
MLPSTVAAAQNMRIAAAFLKPLHEIKRQRCFAGPPGRNVAAAQYWHGGVVTRPAAALFCYAAYEPACGR